MARRGPSGGQYLQAVAVAQGDGSAGAGWKFDRGKPPPGEAEAGWRHRLSDADHTAEAVGEHDIEWKPHTEGVNALRRGDDEAFAGGQALSAEQASPTRGAVAGESGVGGEQRASRRDPQGERLRQAGDRVEEVRATAWRHQGSSGTRIT